MMDDPVVPQDDQPVGPAPVVDEPVVPVTPEPVTPVTSVPEPAVPVPPEPTAPVTPVEPESPEPAAQAEDMGDTVPMAEPAQEEQA